MTALITTQVRATYTYPNGSPVVGAKVVANLSKYENDNGLVVPTSITSLTDENGSATLSLWPNSRGVGGSTYSIYISKDNKTIWSGTVVVPELDTIVDVHTILQTTATPALDAAQIAVLQAQEYAAQAAASAQAAALSGGGGGGVDIVSVKDVSNGIAGLTLFKINLLNALGTIKSFITTLATAPRTYTFPDKDITVAGLSDITGTNSGTNTGDETTATIKTKLGITTISGDNTGDESSSSIKTKLGITTLSGDNTGDESAASIKTKLGITTLSGSNTGDETSATIKSKLGVTVLSGSNTGDQTLTSLGIPNVENKSSADIRGELTSGNVTTALGYTPPTQSALDAKMANPLTTAGDMIIGGIGGVPTRLPVGTDGQICTVVSGLPAWVAASSNAGSDFLSALLTNEVSITGATTLTASALGKMHVCTGTTVDYTVVLPAVAGNAGKFIAFRMSPALTMLVTLDGNASELIDGAAIRVMWTNEVAILFCDGTSWTKIGGKSIPMYAIMRLVGGNPSQAQLLSNSILTKVQLNQTDASVGGMADVTNKRINIRRAGTYAVSGLVYGQSNGTTLYRFISSLYKNSSDLFGGECSTVNSVSWGWTQVEGRPVLAANDFIELYAYAQSATSGGTYLYGAGTGSSNILSIMEIPSW